jgi:hypothetical protein
MHGVITEAGVVKVVLQIPMEGPKEDVMEVREEALADRVDQGEAPAHLLATIILQEALPVATMATTLNQETPAQRAHQELMLRVLVLMVQ